MSGRLYKNTTDKSSRIFADDFKTVAARYGFSIANENNMNMTKTFSSHGVKVEDGFDLHMIQVCNPDKAAGSLQENPERAILMPKFVMAFSDGEQTQIRFRHHNKKVIEAIIDDQSFPESLTSSYRKIISMIEEAI